MKTKKEKKRLKRQVSKKQKKESKPTVVAEVKKPVVKNTVDIIIRESSRAFYEIMRDETEKGKFVSGIWILERLLKRNFDLQENPKKLWGLWRHVENDYPHAIDFIPQSTVLWNKAPAGWRYVGPPQHEGKRKKKLK